MDVSINFLRIFLISLLFIVSSVYADTCVKRNVCSCVFSNGTGIDLSPSAKNDVYQAINTYEDKSNGTRIELVLSTYYYHPCYDILMKINTTYTNATNSCKDASALCRHTISWNGNGSIPDTITRTGEALDWLANTTDLATVKFADDGSYINYTSNEPSFTLVYLVCAETDDVLYVKDLSEPKELKLTFFSRNACLRQIESTRSVGSTLLIIFFSFVIFYLVLGVCTKKFLMGATGIEVIPNLMFWTELPNLVKDGWAFARSGFKLPTRGPGPSTSPDPNSYDSI